MKQIGVDTKLEVISNAQERDGSTGLDSNADRSLECGLTGKNSDGELVHDSSTEIMVLNSTGQEINSKGATFWEGEFETTRKIDFGINGNNQVEEDVQANRNSVEKRDVSNKAGFEDVESVCRCLGGENIKFDMTSNILQRDQTFHVCGPENGFERVFQEPNDFTEKTVGELGDGVGYNGCTPCSTITTLDLSSRCTSKANSDFCTQAGVNQTEYVQCGTDSTMNVLAKTNNTICSSVVLTYPTKPRPALNNQYHGCRLECLACRYVWRRDRHRHRQRYRFDQNSAPVHKLEDALQHL